ncbi:MAG: Rieske 2Fe-2S domain-containing protein [Chloroflexi bacterium]|nr:Rieske 2Fe-2S domain-containing protein [Chloroflexota bacterium]MBV9134753.1 Rieske 2Fe-2S domain-containing protein [Chloroflexota bacterium]MBV9894696.1 Rieske 2Fe-2S domain-containing protein [Chloroflexota bacterium]
MLSREENELITRVGPDTPMGRLMRQFWIPALLSSELPEPDCAPVRVLLLCERLIAFRDTTGKVGLIQNHCPHRGASLFFGRNEEAGLRCVYHGWKFDTDGNCIDMPNEPAESDFKSKVRAVAYPCVERNGLVWTYMGPRPTPPPLPDIEGNMQPNSVANAFTQVGNWLQILEGDLDTIHAGLLHYGSIRVEDQPLGTFSEYQIRDRTARFEMLDTDAGVTYGAYRPAGPGERYWRIAQYYFPFWASTPPGVLGLKVMQHARVPMDDEHTISFTVVPRRPSHPAAQLPPDTARPVRDPWFDRLANDLCAVNDFGIDRSVQRQNTGPDGFTGIHGIIAQDGAMTTSMGPTVDRTREHLGSTDAAIIRVRRRLLTAARALEETGSVPACIDNPAAFHHRAGGVLLPEDVDWIEATRELRKGFVDHPELDPAINGPL